jgi:hypothetical protein
MRKYQYVVTSDVYDMFLKIRLDPNDSKYHRFVFNKEDYEQCVIFFGNLSSPNASQKVMWINCDINGTEYPEAVETVKNSCYMDDCCDSRETEEQAEKSGETTHQTSRTCSNGHPKVLFQFRVSHHTMQSQFTFKTNLI